MEVQQPEGQDEVQQPEVQDDAQVGTAAETVDPVEKPTETVDPVEKPTETNVETLEVPSDETVETVQADQEQQQEEEAVQEQEEQVDDDTAEVDYPSDDAPSNPPSDEDDALRKIKTRKRAVRKPAAKVERKRHRRSEPEHQEVELSEPEPDSVRERRQLEERIDAALKPTRQKKISGDDLEQMQDDRIAELRVQMRDAAMADAECIQRGEPALNKLGMLKDVKSVLSKQALAESILDGNLLESVRIWLEPLPDASLPSHEIQMELFKVMQQLPIKTTHLRESGLGKVVLFYQKSKRPHLAIKRMADRLIGDWTRPIMGRSDNYRDKQVRTYSYNPDDLNTSAQNPQALTLAEETANRRNRAAIPTSRATTYEVAPVNQVASSMTPRGGSDHLRRIKNKIAATRGKTRKSGVSVEGKNLH